MALRDMFCKVVDSSFQLCRWEEVGTSMGSQTEKVMVVVESSSCCLSWEEKVVEGSLSWKMMMMAAAARAVEERAVVVMGCCMGCHKLNTLCIQFDTSIQPM